MPFRSRRRPLRRRPGASSQRRQPLHHGVEAGTPGTLHPQEVPVPALALPLAVVAPDVHHPRQVLRHGLHLDVPRPRRPRRAHGRPAHHGLLAYRAAVVEPGQVAEAVRVYGVTARQVLGALAGGEHVLPAHRAVVLVLVRHAGVGVVHGGGDAHAAAGAVAEPFAPADAAEAALVAVEGTLLEVHPDVALGAVVLGEGYSAADARIRPGGRRW